MKRRLLSALAAASLATGSLFAVSAPAHASDAPGVVCMLTSNAWLREWPGGPVLRTLHAGRGFRWHMSGYFDGVHNWYYGHGAEAPSQDGYVIEYNLNC